MFFRLTSVVVSIRSLFFLFIADMYLIPIFLTEFTGNQTQFLYNPFSSCSSSIALTCYCQQECVHSKSKGLSPPTTSALTNQNLKLEALSE